MPENERRDSECKGRGEKKENRKKKERVRKKGNNLYQG